MLALSTLLLTALGATDAAASGVDVHVPEASGHMLLAHVDTSVNRTNASKSRQLRERRDRARPLSRAAAVVAAHDWWCGHDGREGTLRCRRHLLQQKHRQAKDEVEREAVSKQLTALLVDAGEAALAAMQEEGQVMLHGWCALSGSASLDVCSSSGHAGK